MINILEKLGLNYEDLTEAERSTLNQWQESLAKSQLTLEDVKTHIGAMRHGVEKEIVDEPEFNYIFIFKVPNRKQVMLKARLKNYLMLEEMLLGPERARKAIEKALSSRT